MLTPVPIFEVFTQQDGLDLPSMEEQREENPHHIEDAVRPVDVPVLDEVNTLAHAESVLQAARQSATPTRAVDAMLVRFSDGSWYALTADELKAALGKFPAETSLKAGSQAENALPLLFPDMPLDSALPHFARWPLLPVRNRAAKGLLEGIITSEDVMQTYQRG